MAKKITRVGRYRVEDASRSYTAGEELSLRQLAGYQRRAARTILQDVQNVEPEVLRYARKALGLTQADLGALLGVSAETVSRWESGAEPFKPAIQLALAGLLDTAERMGGEITKPQSRAPAGETVTLKAS